MSASSRAPARARRRRSESRLLKVRLSQILRTLALQLPRRARTEHAFRFVCASFPGPAAGGAACQQSPD
eukprot:279685-Alexandrium_andersonii.AAC.1